MPRYAPNKMPTAVKRRYFCHDPHQPGQPRVRECESRGHARAVLAGLPDHYLPAHVVTRAGGRWQPHPDSAADRRDPARTSR